MPGAKRSGAPVVGGLGLRFAQPPATLNRKVILRWALKSQVGAAVIGAAAPPLRAGWVRRHAGFLASGENAGVSRPLQNRSAGGYREQNRDDAELEKTILLLLPSKGQRAADVELMGAILVWRIRGSWSTR